MMNEYDCLKSHLPNDWFNLLQDEFNQNYMLSLQNFLVKEASEGKTIYPSLHRIFEAFKLTSLKNVKVVIIGQDPYHGPNQAHGLSFSVQPGVKIPPSLKNIYKEIKNEYGFEIPKHGFLESWANQGVLLLNAVLTVEQAKAGSHQKKGWEIFTDEVVHNLNEECENLVFLLWGAHAQKKGKEINKNKHLVLESVHPSPLSAHRGFFGCNHFILTNKYLEDHGKTAINWSIQ